MTIKTARHKLPLLAVGQAQKEYTHNEALLLIDNLLHSSIISIVNDPEEINDLDSESDNRAWLIGEAPVGIWSNRANQIAVMGLNGFRYIVPSESMTLYNQEQNCMMMYRNMAWSIAPVTSVPIGGSVIDSQSRQAIAAILTILEQFGLSRA